MIEQKKERQLFPFTWYHREEFQVLLILFGLIIFFARSLWGTRNSRCIRGLCSIAFISNENT